MSTLEDQVIAIGAKLDTVVEKLGEMSVAIATIPAAQAVDLTPVLTAVADVRAQFNPSPTPAP